MKLKRYFSSFLTIAYSYAVFSISFLALCGCTSGQSRGGEVNISDEPQSMADFRAAPLDLDAPFLREHMVEEGVYRFGKGDVFLGVMKILDAPAAASTEIAYSLENRCGFNRISRGEEMSYTMVEEIGLSSFSFPCGDYEILHVRFEEGQPIAQIEEIPHQEIERVYMCKVEINSSMIGSAVREGITEGQVISLTSLFRSDIDFNNDIHPGDKLRLWVREIQDNRGNTLGPGKILAAQFILKGKEYWGIRYEGEEGKGFYDRKGWSLKKSFLKSPLPFLRVTSGFALRRFHPILGKVRPHLGVDFGAPTGTPVLAAANGRVVFAGWIRGYGKTIKIRHDPNLLTLYGHLSKIEVKNGERVKQGKIIGRVGATGLATGPHLHYGMYKKGKAVNPMKVEMETAAVIDSPAFKVQRDRAVELLSNPVPGNVPEENSKP